VRTVWQADKQRIAEWMQIHNTSVFDDSYLAPSYNVAPRSFEPVVRLTDDGARELQLMRWVRSQCKAGIQGTTHGIESQP
jgi:putative SOS response-associated peptidase YedK